MTTPRLSHQITDPNDPKEEIGRMYSRYPDGEPEVPSITTLIAMKNAKMEWWRGLCAGKEAVAGAERIATALSSLEGHARMEKERAITDWIDKSAVRDMNIASKRGDIIHDYAEKLCRHMLGESFDIPTERETAMNDLHVADPNLAYESANGYLSSVESFLKDFEVKPVTAEGTVWNHEVGYAGTNDLLCYINDKLTLLDWKTKKKIKDPNSRWYKPSIRDTIAIQLEAAQHGDEKFDEDKGEWVEWEGTNAEEQLGVAIGPNGYEAIRVIRKPDTWEMVKALKQVWDWSFPNNDHIVGTPVTDPSQL